MSGESAAREVASFGGSIPGNLPTGNQDRREIYADLDALILQFSDLFAG